jgi:predicted Zn-dependent protease with MMP-like domain
MAWMERERFEELVAEALQNLPEEFTRLMQNVDVVVEDEPPRSRRRGGLLLGLYEGVPRTARGEGYNLVVPDKITIFQRPLESICATDEELKREVRSTVLHEVGHHFGLDDYTLSRIEATRPRRRG